MGAGSKDIFGNASGAEPAAAGSYGQAPRAGRLPDAAQPGPVHLQIAELARSLTFYQDVLGMRVLERHGGRARLGAHDDSRVLVELHERPGAHAAGRRRRLGLYHYAILLPDRAALGRFVRHLAERGVAAGAADHLVSEALYLSDPDGLGIEVYADRPRTAWRRVGRELMMASDPLDAADLARAAGQTAWSGMPARTVMGHVHLHVGDLDAAAAFYADALGFDRTVWSYPGALFFGAGGYHHHLGTNTWAGPGARAPADDDARLLEWTLELPDAASIAEAGRRLEEGGYPADASSPDDGIATRDPWGTQLRLRVAGASVTG
jgi:catechol 2,3-dioxygenase